MITEKNPKGHLALLGAYLLFGINNPIAKAVLSHGEISAVSMTFYRMAGAAVLFWLAALFMKRQPVSRTDLFKLMGASLFGILLNQHAFVAGLSHATVIDASVITSTGPIVTMILAAFILREPITWKKAIGVGIGAIGALLLIMHSTVPVNGREGSSLTGIMLCLVSTISFAIYLTAFKSLILRYSPVTLMKWMFLFSAVLYIPFSWHDVTSVPYATMSADMYLGIAYVVIMATFVSYLLIPVGQKLLRPTVVSMYNYIQPIVSSIVAVVAGMDSFGLLKGVATLLVFVGVFVVTRSKSAEQSR